MREMILIGVVFVALIWSSSSFGDNKLVTAANKKGYTNVVVLDGPSYTWNIKCYKQWMYHIEVTPPQGGRQKLIACHGLFFIHFIEE